MRLLEFKRGLLIAAFSLCLGLSGHLSAQAPAAEEDIRGPKALVEIQQPQKTPIMLWASIVGGVLVLSAAAIFWHRRQRKTPVTSPTEIALADLKKIAASYDLVTAEVFANRAAQTVRSYISARFGLAAPRRTTEEFLRDLAKQDGLSLIGESDYLKAFLKSCDLAKFAGSNLSTAQREDLLQSARNFVAVAPVTNIKPPAIAP
ncbi:MAG: hypothetical protein WCL19_03440 [Verrucomicrobiota bacterium]